MKTPVFSTQFKKDMELAEKRKKDLIKIKAIMFDLICENPLPEKNQNHPLSGNYKGHMECHIEPDWLLIYRYVGTELRLGRTGTHSDLY
jgi:mRNA interferase YafQ